MLIAKAPLLFERPPYLYTVSYMWGTKVTSHMRTYELLYTYTRENHSHWSTKHINQHYKTSYSITTHQILGASGLPSYSDRVPLMSIWRLMAGSLSLMKTASKTASFLFLGHLAMMLVLLTIMLRVRGLSWLSRVCLSGAPFCKCMVIRRDKVVVV